MRTAARARPTSPSAHVPSARFSAPARATRAPTEQDAAPGDERKTAAPAAPVAAALPPPAPPATSPGPPPSGGPPPAAPAPAAPGDGAAPTGDAPGMAAIAGASHDAMAGARRGPATPPGLVVDDGARAVPPGAMARARFLDALESSVRSAIDEGLAGTGRDSDGCPYLERWLAYYRERSASQLERAVRRYAPEARAAASAAGYVDAVAARVRRGARSWALTGEPTGVPDELAGAARRALETGDPEVVRAALGRGEPLDGGTRARMETAFGHDFARVRVHTGSAAARATAGLDARAVAVGTDVAFAPGEYRPGSPAGDALLAHELAHVVQQGGATGADAGSLDAGAAEHDADDAAVGAVASLWGRTTRAAERVRAAMPRLRSGLALRACRSRPTGTCHVTSGPSYSPSGTIPVTTTGTTKQAATFTMSATFANDSGAGRVPACCEVRQFIKWDTAFHTQAGGPPHSGFPSTAGPNVWHEDRDSADTRYGHRSGSHSAPSSGDEYRTGGTRDQANGDTYHGSDAPSGFASDVGQYQFQLKVIDTCNGNAEKASSSIITINW